MNIERGQTRAPHNLVLRVASCPQDYVLAFKLVEVPSRSTLTKGMDILESVSGIHIIYQIACLSPSLIDRKLWTLKRSKLLEIYVFIVIIFSVAFMLYGLFTDDDFLKTNDNDVGQTVDFIQMVGIRVSHIVSLSECLVRRNEQKRFYEEVKEIDRIFECSLNVDVNNKKFRRTTIKRGILMAFFYLAAEFFILTSKLVAEEQNFILFWIFYLMPLLICGIRYFQMFTSMCILKHRFDLLVKVLNQINLRKHICEPNDMNIMDSVNGQAPLNISQTLALLESSILKKRHCDMENPELKKLLIVRDLYNRLFNLSEILNGYFGVSMLINVGNDFISITSNCYWIFYNFQDFHSTRNDFLLIAGSAVWCVPHLLNVLVLAILCEKTVQTTNSIALGLHRIDIDIMNDNHNSVIEQFSLQLLHQKMSITAAGFFSIDCTLLYTIVGATTTYLIILIQFHMNESKNEETQYAYKVQVKIMKLTQKILQVYLLNTFYISGFQTIPRLPWLSALIRIFYLCWLSTVVFLMFYWRMNGGDTSVGGLVGTASFLANGTVNIIILLETICKEKYYKRMVKRKQEVDELLNQYLNVNVCKHINYKSLTKRLIIIVVLQLICDALKMWINCISKISPVFWYLLPITISLRTRYLQIISTIMTLNRRIEILRDVIAAVAKKNEPKSKFSSDIWQPYNPAEYEKVNYMRLIYMRMWESYMSFNNLYSWSLLTLFMSSFFDIVCNCYWTFTALYKGQAFHKYVMNGATSFSLTSLVYVLFYFTDASNNNVIFIILWCCEIVWSTYLAINYHIFGDGHSLDDLVSFILYFAHVLGHLVALAESFSMRQERIALVEHFKKISMDLREELKKPQYANLSVMKMCYTILEIIILLTCGHVIIMWTTFKTKSPAGLLYWRSLQSYLALQIKTLEFLTPIVRLSHYTLVIRKTLNQMGERNLRKVFKVLNKYEELDVIMVATVNEEVEDEKLLIKLKNCYNEIYATIQMFNTAYGWSMLASTAVFFVDFVSNSYWILLAVLSQGRDYYGLLQNAAFALLAFILLTLICWYAEACYYESRYIGCLISKLVKPLGNKFYNDLVSEFSVQTLHQRFIITAKEFFSLNLSLLGSMVAAIVTYLVILIQFMFTEKSNNEIFILLWCCEIAWSTYLAIIYDIFGDEHSLDGLVSFILYFTHMMGHLIVLAEAWNMRKYRLELYENFNNISKALKGELKKAQNAGMSGMRMSCIVLGVIILLTCGHGIIMWTTFETKSPASLLYWRSLQSYLALQFRTLEFLTGLVYLSYYTLVIRKSLNTMGERNLKRVFKCLNNYEKCEVIMVTSLNEEEEDEQLLLVIKNCYNEIYSTIKIFNAAYGWSILASTAVFFVDFVCNTYWILLAVLSQDRDYYGLLQNAAFALLAFILLTIICWYAEECYYESRYIGCLIAKLVKPLGTKFYNDLVSEFSVQTLHQRFVITAKEFFSLNLSLLGSMVAAIVTYLVILIQFMFSEKSNNESKLSTKTVLATSTTPSILEINN
ncbi:putative gustatory receptor 2a [Lucilia cuprina]|nr:putative gustatory receptor 2a [Lucilia cuprina]